MSKSKRPSRAVSAEPASNEPSTTDETTGLSLWVAAASLGAFVLVSGPGPSEPVDDSHLHDPAAVGLELHGEAADSEDAAEPPAQPEPQGQNDHGPSLRVDDLELEPGVAEETEEEALEAEPMPAAPEPEQEPGVRENKTAPAAPPAPEGSKLELPALPVPVPPRVRQRPGALPSAPEQQAPVPQPAPVPPPPAAPPEYR